ncbi:MAG: ankyrin repeat domain-containing protein, partial [Verrucomicrobiota bacterium]
KDFSALGDSSHLKLKRQRRQYNPKNVKELQIFAAISKHNPKNNIDTIGEIKNLLNEVDINYQDNDGDTFLHAAIKEEHQDIVELLVDAGADSAIQNKEHKTALDLAKLSSTPNRQKIIDLLAQPGPSNRGPGPSVSHNVPRINPIAPETYPASGLKHSLHGNIYQLKLLMLFLNRGLIEGYDFRLSTEWNAAEKFDDLVFKYSDQGKTNYRFLQAKHKQDKSKKITVGELFTTDKDGEFNLEKYFISYLRIKKNPTFQSSNLEDFIICTNIDFDLASTIQGQAKTLKIIKAGKNKGKEISVEEINSDDVFFKNGGTRYKLQASNGLIAHLKQGDEVKKEIQGQNINIDKEIDDFLE